MSVTARGGYQIVDGANAQIVIGSAESVIIPGIYKKALNQVNKPCFFGGLSVVDGNTVFTIPFQLVVFTMVSVGMKFTVKPDQGSEEFEFIIDNTDDTLSIGTINEGD